MKCLPSLLFCFTLDSPFCGDGNNQNIIVLAEEAMAVYNNFLKINKKKPLFGYHFNSALKVTSKDVTETCFDVFHKRF